MKTILKYASSLGIVSLFILLSCESKKETNMDQAQSQVKQYGTVLEAVTKGKNDLIEILRTDKNNGLNLDAASVEKAQAEESISAVDVDFDRFLKADSLQNFRDVSGEEKGKITPLYAENKMVTTIHTRIDSGGWSVSGIKDPLIEAEISEIRNKTQAYHGSNITLYEIPNIDAHVYSIGTNGQELYYSNYKGMSLDQPIAFAELSSMLRKDAMEFQRQYGDMIKKEKLVK